MIQQILEIVASIDKITFSTIVINFIPAFIFFSFHRYFIGLFSLFLACVFFYAKIQYHYYNEGDVSILWFIFNVGTASLLIYMSKESFNVNSDIKKLQKIFKK